MAIILLNVAGASSGSTPMSSTELIVENCQVVIEGTPKIAVTDETFSAQLADGDLIRFDLIDLNTLEINAGTSNSFTIFAETRT